MLRPIRSLVLICVLVLVAASCGSDDATEVSTADTSVAAQDETGAAGSQQDGPIPVEPDGGIGDGAEPLPGAEEGPIPVEPDGGIGDGAEPLPGAEEPEESGTWHGPQVAETNCPGTVWQRVEASAFTFSVPEDFEMAEAQPIDSEVGVWNGPNGIEVLYDYGWYSGEFAGTAGAENEPVDYSGITGTQTVVRSGERMFVGVFFGEVAVVDGQSDRLSLMVTFEDPADEIIGRCIVGSIDWK